jgi:hypothetical protein
MNISAARTRTGVALNVIVNIWPYFIFSLSLTTRTWKLVRQQPKREARDGDILFVNRVGHHHLSRRLAPHRRRVLEPRPTPPAPVLVPWPLALQLGWVATDTPRCWGELGRPHHPVPVKVQPITCDGDHERVAVVRPFPWACAASVRGTRTAAKLVHMYGTPLYSCSNGA